MLKPPGDWDPGVVPTETTPLSLSAIITQWQDSIALLKTLDWEHDTLKVSLINGSEGSSE